MVNIFYKFIESIDKDANTWNTERLIARQCRQNELCGVDLKRETQKKFMWQCMLPVIFW